MSQVTVSTEFNAPIEAVWQIVMHPQRLGEWVTIHKSVSDCPSNGLQVEDRFSQKLVLAGVPFTVHWTVKEIDPPYRAVWQGRGPAGSLAKTIYELKALGANSTLFNYHNEFDLPGGPLGALGGRILVGGFSEREAKKSLKKLKALIEKEA